MNTTQEYRHVVDQMCKEFVKKYYDEEDYKADWYLVGTDIDRATGPLSVNDDFWSIDQVYEALQNNIPYERMIDWLYKYIEIHPKSMKVNFPNYCKYTCFDLDGMKKDLDIKDNQDV